MRYIILLIVVVSLGWGVKVYALDSAGFDYANGVPSITDDTTTTCNNQATVAYEYANGVPSQVFDTTATCNVAVATGGATYVTSIPTSYSVVIPSGYLMIVQ